MNIIILYLVWMIIIISYYNKKEKRRRKLEINCLLNHLYTYIKFNKQKYIFKMIYNNNNKQTNINEKKSEKIITKTNSIE